MIVHLRISRSFFLFSAIVLVFASCSPTKHLAEGQYLLVKNKIHIENKNVDQEELQGIIKQKPNRKILGLVRFHLGVYNYASRKEKDTRIRKWLKNTVGEPPVLHDQALTQKSTEQLNLYLKNKGYFHSVVKDSVFFKKKKAIAHYYIETGQPYTIRKVAFSYPDTNMIAAVRKSSRQTLIRPGDNFNVEVFEKERERITKDMKNMGFYAFAKEYIRYDVDSTQKKYRVDVITKVLNPYEKKVVNGEDTLIQTTHRKYRINDIFINTNYSLTNTVMARDTLFFDGYSFINGSTMNFRPNVLKNAILLQKGDLYKLSNEKGTYNRLAGLRTFKFISIEFREIGSEDTVKVMDCYINLSPTPRQSTTLETEGTNRSGNLGIAGNIAYRNKNSFKGAEILEFKLKGGLEAQQLANDDLRNEDAQVIEDFTPFNTLELGSELSLFIPSLLLSRNISLLEGYSDPKTNIKLAFNHQNRPDYTRNLANVIYGFSLNGEERSSSLIISPVEISLIQIEKQKEFEETLLATGNSLLINSYNNHLISASQISYIYSNQKLNKLRNFYYYRINLEGAGNMLRAVNNLAGAEKDRETDSYDLLNIRFAQYVKTDITFTKHNILNKSNRAVYRIYSGIGIPLKNLDVLPFERSFFVGGANDLRGWQARTLGPGSLSDTARLNIDQIGDIVLEGNAEYRFKITKIIEGATFIDIGNIWLLDEDKGRPGGEFKFNRFYNEFAFSPGVGTRLNFSFFILRLDVGMQLRDPALPDGERWLFQPKTKTNQHREEANEYRNSVGLKPLNDYKTKFNLNLGIDYPF